MGIQERAYRGFCADERGLANDRAFSSKLFTSLSHLLRGEPVNWWRRYAQNTEIGVDLRAMMNLVLHHGAKPLPCCDRRSAGGNALLFKIGGGKAPENCHGLGVHAIEE